METKSKRCVLVLAEALSLFNALFFFALRPMWSGVIAVLGQASPYAIWAVMLVCAIVGAVLVCAGARGRVWRWIALSLSIIFLGLEGYILSVTLDSWRYFLRAFVCALGVAAVIALLFWLVLRFPKTKAAGKKWICIPAAVLLVLAILIPHIGLYPNEITCTPVVYAVEDSYQIVFTTRTKSTAWVDVGGVEYADTYAGSKRSEDTVHKITVPMDVLDAAGAYTVSARSMLLRGPYCALQGQVISESHEWRGVNTADGINYYVISDTHTDYDAPTRAASYWGDKLDFLICCGDTANWIDSPMDIAYWLKIAGDVTGGAIPVVYARGNHETKGVMADELYRYVGANGENFYFTFRLQNIWGVVLDLGEDHGDDWAEFFDSSRFDAYRAEQTVFLDEILADAENEFAAEGVTYRIAVCHIPLTFQYQDDHVSAVKTAWVERLNQMNLTVLFGGHRHQLIYLDTSIPEGTPLTYYEAYAGYDGTEPDGYVGNATFPSILVSRKSTVQPISVEEQQFDRVFIGVAAYADANETTLIFTNQDGSVLTDLMSPWFSELAYGDQIVLPNR